LVRNALWESLESGAIGTHIFAWQDRPYITDREKGFGILYENRGIKPAFWVSRDTFNLMEQVKINELLGGSSDPKPDIAFLWTAANDSQYNRYECEMQQIAGALERLGYEAYFMNLNDLATGVYTNYRLIVLPRNMRVDDVVPDSGGKSVLEFLRTVVIPKGVNILATADLPGLQNQNGLFRTAFTNELKNLFGVDASDIGGFEAPQRRREYVSWFWKPISVRFTTNAIGPVANGYTYAPDVWKYNDETLVTSGGVLWADMDTKRNKGFEDSSTTPAQWNAWGTVSIVSGWGWQYDGNNMARLWGDSGIWQDFPVVSCGRYTASAYFRSNHDDPLAGGTYASVAIEWLDEDGNSISVSESPRLTNQTPADAWVRYAVDAIAPMDAYTGRRIIRTGILTNSPSPSGSVYVDNKQRAPAVVVKNHGTAKSAIFLYSAGDIKPDSNNDGQPDVLPWKWRYDVFGAVVRDYFGIQPLIQISGTNNWLCMVDYRTCADTSTLWQVKNYQYDTNYVNGGPALTFTITSDLFTGRTVKALGQAKILSQNCNGTISLTLPPDGMEMLHVFKATTNTPIVQIADAPSAVHPFADKTYSVKIKYDTAGKTNLVLKIVYVGGAYSNQIYQTVITNVTGVGEKSFDFWIPDSNQNDTNYVSTSEGGNYQIQAWLEDASSNRLSETVPQPVELNWGVRPTTPLPTQLTPGTTTNITIKWENLSEQLSWQNTPMARNDAFPSRVGLYRSTKTEARYPGHLAKVNEVANWLESMGYTNGNTMDVSFDQVLVLAPPNTNLGLNAIFTAVASNGLTGWTASGLWHVSAGAVAGGVPGFAYNNETNYSTGARTTGELISPWIDLSDVTAANLSFKSWHQTEDANYVWDRKQVHVTVDGTNWVLLAKIYGPASQWTTPTFDLAEYAGHPIQLKFTFDSVDGIQNNYAGWLVDNIQVAAMDEGPSDLFADSMESTTNWTASGLWRLSTNRSASGVWSWVYNNGVNYSTGARTTGNLLSPWIDLREASKATLDFKFWYKTEDTGRTWDRKWVYASLDDTNWTMLAQITGPAEQWRDQSLDLGAYVGRFVRLKFTFDSIDQMNNAFEGWYVDDVRVSAPEATVAPVFQDQAEHGLNGWKAEGLWHQASDLFVSGSNSWAFNNGTNYSTGARATGALLSPWISLANARNASLTFQSWYETEDTGVTWDKKLVYASIDGSNWVKLLQVTGDKQKWLTQSVSLNQFLDKRLQLKFLFDSVDAVQNNYRGWYLDDIAVNMGADKILFSDAFAGAGLGTNWTRAAGAANWQTENESLRSWRIGNDDNIIMAGNPAWSNYTVQADVRYNHIGPYFNDAEIYLRYQNRENYYKVGFKNYYGSWRLKYTVKVGGNVVDQDWLCTLPKTNSPVEGAWYRLAVTAQGTNINVLLDGMPVGSFAATNFATGRIGLGTRAVQLGIWEPQKGYYFIDDDEYSVYGTPLNMDWGYLKQFFGTLILPGVYVMSAAEVSNTCTWINGGMFSLLATDGGTAMLKDNGSNGVGRMEGLFGVAPVLNTVTGLESIVVGTNEHYVTLDYARGSAIAVDGAAMAWTTITNAHPLATLQTSSNALPSLITRKFNVLPETPSKVLCFNFAADTQGQLTNSLKDIAQRAFQWARGQAFKVDLSLMYRLGTNTARDLKVFTTNAWILTGSGQDTLSINLPSSGIMSGSNLYWQMYIYPWDATNGWLGHAGFYESYKDNVLVNVPGKGLQIIGITDRAYAGRAWDLYAAYNTRGEMVRVGYGIKDKGWVELDEAFSNGTLQGWTITPHTNISWTLTNGMLRADVVSTGGYASVMKDNLSITGRNVTIEYDVLFTNGAAEGGLVYGGTVLYANPSVCGWADSIPTFTNTSLLSSGKWHRIVIHIRDGDPWWNSDLNVDGTNVFVQQPIEVTNFANGAIGFLSPYYRGSVLWDNVRVVDEEYSLAWQSYNGEVVPTAPNAWISIPDYDAGMWEHEGTTLGGLYEWFIYMKGAGRESRQNTAVYFAPRLMVEKTNFPTSMTVGDTVNVPVEWEQLPQLPSRLSIALQDVYPGSVYGTTTYTITNVTGQGTFPVTIPTGIPAHSNYMWLAYMYPPSASRPFDERIGMDDTFRFGPNQVPLMPEVAVGVSGPTVSDYMVFKDNYMMPYSRNNTWGPICVFDGLYTGETPPEGSQCYRSQIIGSWGGWGVFRDPPANTLDMSAYANGAIKFWLKSSATLKVDIEAPPGVKAVKYIPSTGAVWTEITIPLQEWLEEYPSVDISRMFGLFLITKENGPTTFHVDDIRWVKTP
jgi:hypothetical protein